MHTRKDYWNNSNMYLEGVAYEWIPDMLKHHTFLHLQIVIMYLIELSTYKCLKM